MSYEKILVPTDFSPHAEHALETALELARKFDSTVYLVHAYFLDVPPAYIAGAGAAYINPQDILEPLRERALEMIEGLSKDVAARGFEVEGSVVMGHAAEVILDTAGRLPADVIVMGTRGLTGFKHVLLGSTAERVVRMATCPVLTVKANESDDA